MVDFKDGAEPGKILVGRISGAGDRLRFVVERAGIGIFDRNNAVFELWKRWGEGGAKHSYPISSRPPSNVRAGVIDVNIRTSGVSVAQVVEDAENLAGVFSNVVSVENLTNASIQAGAVERETVRRKAVEEGAGAGFDVITRPFKETFERLETVAKVTLAVGAILGIGFLVFQVRAASPT